MFERQQAFARFTSLLSNVKQHGPELQQLAQQHGFQIPNLNAELGLTPTAPVQPTQPAVSDDDWSNSNQQWDDSGCYQDDNSWTSSSDDC